MNPAAPPPPRQQRPLFGDWHRIWYNACTAESQQQQQQDVVTDLIHLAQSLGIQDSQIRQLLSTTSPSNREDQRRLLCEATRPLVQTLPSMLPTDLILEIQEQLPSTRDVVAFRESLAATTEQRLPLPSVQRWMQRWWYPLAAVGFDVTPGGDIATRYASQLQWRYYFEQLVDLLPSLFLLPLLSTPEAQRDATIPARIRESAIGDVPEFAPMPFCPVSYFSTYEELARYMGGRMDDAIDMATTFHSIDPTQVRQGLRFAMVDLMTLPLSLDPSNIRILTVNLSRDNANVAPTIRGIRVQDVTGTEDDESTRPTLKEDTNSVLLNRALAGLRLNDPRVVSAFEDLMRATRTGTPAGFVDLASYYPPKEDRVEEWLMYPRPHLTQLFITDLMHWSTDLVTTAPTTTYTTSPPGYLSSDVDDDADAEYLALRKFRSALRFPAYYHRVAVKDEFVYWASRYLIWRSRFAISPTDAEWDCNQTDVANLFKMVAP